MFFKKSIIGVDVSDSAIKIVVLDKNKKLISHVHHTLPPGIVVKGDIPECESFVSECKKALAQINDEHINKKLFSLEAIVSLPEGKVWSHSILIPKEISTDKQGTYLRGEAEKIIPENLSDYYTTSSVSEVRGLTLGTFVASEKSLVDMYVSCLSEADLNVSFVGSNFYSIARAVLPRAFGDDNYIVIDIGSQQTTLGAFDESSIAYITIKSDALSSADDSEALAAICEDISQIKQYFEKQTGQRINQVILTGQVTDLEAVASFLKLHAQIVVNIADPLQHINNANTLKKSAQLTSFANAIGLAMYGVDRTLPHINLLPEKKPHVSFHLSKSEESKQLQLSRVQDFISKITRIDILLRLKNQYKLLVTVAFALIAFLLLIYVIKQYI